MARKILIDCDPGQDDALMLLLAFAARDRLDICGITAVAGNVPLAKTERNTRLICDVAGVSDVPVYAGCDRPLVNKLYTAEDVHGQEGIDGMAIGTPRTPLQSAHAVDYMVDCLGEVGDDGITIVATGPLTNVATAIRRDPSVLPKIKEIVIMGGARTEGGNITPSAEFNIFVDPHAAHDVFSCGRPLAIFGLDVTHQVFTSPDVLARLAPLDSPAAKAAHGMLSFFGRHDSQRYGAEGAPLHDPCTVAYLLEPQLFELKSCNIRIETDSKLTKGHTAVDFWNTSRHPKNALWAHKVDRDGFFDLMVGALETY